MALEPLALSARARQLIAWITSRSTPTQPLAANDVATAVGSRRLAGAAAAELVQAGLLQNVGENFVPTPAILESAQLAGAAGRVDEPAVPKSHAAQLAPIGATGSPGQLSHHVDLRARQRALVLGGAERVGGSAPVATSIPEGDAYVASNHNLNSNSRTNLNELLNNYSYLPRARSEDRASVGNRRKGFNKPTTSQATVGSDSRITETASEGCVYTLQQANSACIYTENESVYTPQEKAVYTRGRRMEMAKARAKRVVSGESARVTLGLGAEADAAKAYGVAVAYEEQLGVYLRKPTLRYLKGRVAPGQPNFANWARAAQLADEAGVDYATYVRAQFWAFDAWYGRAPKPQELGSYKTQVPAPERVRLYLEAVAAGKVDAARPILGKQRAIVDTTTSKGRRDAAVKVDPATRSLHSEQQLRALMRNYGLSEEDAFRMFAKGATAHVYFDRKWMLAHPTYQRLHAAGEI